MKKEIVKNGPIDEPTIVSRAPAATTSETPPDTSYVTRAEFTTAIQRLQRSLGDVKKLQSQIGKLEKTTEKLDKTIKVVQKELSVTARAIRQELQNEVAKLKQKQEQDMQKMKDQLNVWHNHLTYNGTYNAVPKIS